MTSAAGHLTIASSPTEGPGFPMPVSGVAVEGGSPRASGIAFISSAEAAERSGRNVGHVNRMCATVWFAQGLARQEKRGKARAGWYVSEEADPAFARVKMAADIGTDLRHLSERQRQNSAYRKQILDAWSAACTAAYQLGFDRNAATGRFVQQLLLGEVPAFRGESIKINRSTLYNWQRRYQAGGLAALADARGTQQAAEAAAKADDPFFARVKELYLTQNRPSLADCVKFASIDARKRGWPVHNYKACQRMIAAIPRQVVILMREGEKAHYDKCEPPIVRDYYGLRSNSIWCADHHTLDIQCAVPDGKGGMKHARPTLSGFEDLRSRMIVGWQISAAAPNADVILASFEAAAGECGLPDQVLIDNGKDFDSRTLQGVTKKERREGAAPDRVIGAFVLCGVNVAHAKPYAPKSKPIERAFGTVAKGFSKWWSTYTGGTTATKPEGLADAMKAGKAPTLEELRESFAEWLAAGYHDCVHTGHAMDGQTPREAFAANLDRKRTMERDLLSFACLPRYGPLKVGRQGVTWKGMFFGAFDSNVQALYGKQVLIAVGDNLSEGVYVLDLDGRLVCKAPPNLRLPFNADKETLREATKLQKQVRKLKKDYVDNRPKMALDPLQMLGELAAEKALAAQPKSEDPPPSIAPHRTAFDDQLPQIREAFETPARQAVGAESVPLPSRFSYESKTTGGDAGDQTAGPSLRDYLALRQREEES
ncbi:DNA-binding domain-containing protein [Humisphaera borealis]|uniref:Helix-turn-helix domain-containing protein n=1 Tax=Humisphaera borealis TaxID=2807512 RepID=A0A7M2X0G9_9BACT|nr:DNA-binding domain-containing protein [Humisphaera borealis]QOV90912.1 helix-turn-helix domain-containing protein [Humisphaera borealis]